MLCVPLTLLGLLAAEPAWETVATGAITVKARPRPGSAVFEIWAEADLAAPVKDIQDTLTTMDRFHQFMPYVKAAKEVSREEDGSVFTYTELGLPVISDRDYVVHVWLDEGVNPDGSGSYRCHWEAAPDRLPARASLVRVKVNEGRWEVTPKDDGKSHVVYRFAADPGGMLPAWAANYGNRRGVSGTLEAIEKEAQRRQKERVATAQKAAEAGRGSVGDPMIRRLLLAWALIPLGCNKTPPISAFCADKPCPTAAEALTAMVQTADKSWATHGSCYRTKELYLDFRPELTAAKP